MKSTAMKRSGWSGTEWNVLEHWRSFSCPMRSDEGIHIERVMYLADVEMAGMMLGQTGEGPISQVASE